MPWFVLLVLILFGTRFAHAQSSSQVPAELKRADKLYGNRQWRDALDQYSKLYSLRQAPPDCDPLLLFRMGQCCQQLNKLGDAVSAWSLLRTKFPQHALAAESLNLEILAARDPLKKKRLQDQLIRNHPQSALARQIIEEQGVQSFWRRDYRRALGLWNTTPTATGTSATPANPDLAAMKTLATAFVTRARLTAEQEQTVLTWIEQIHSTSHAGKARELLTELSSLSMVAFARLVQRIEAENVNEAIRVLSCASAQEVDFFLKDEFTTWNPESAACRVLLKLQESTVDPARVAELTRHAAARLENRGFLAASVPLWRWHFRLTNSAETAFRLGQSLAAENDAEAYFYLRTAGQLTSDESLREKISAATEKLAVRQGENSLKTPSITDPLALGRSSLENGYYAKAIDYFSQHISRNPTAPESDLSRLQLAEAYSRCGRLSSAREMYRALLQSKNLPIAGTAADFLLREQLEGESTLELRQTIAAVVSRGLAVSPELLWSVAVCFFLQGNDADAALLCKQLAGKPGPHQQPAQELLVHSASAGANLGRELISTADGFAAKNPKEALEIYGRLSKRFPSLCADELKFKQAVCWIQLEEPKRAKSILRQFMDTDRASSWAPEALIRLAIIETGHLENPREGEAVLRLALERYPHSEQAARLLFFLGTLRRWAGDDRGADGFFSQVIDKFPASREAAFASANLKPTQTNP